MVTARFKVGRITLFSPTDPVEFAKAVEDGQTKEGYKPSAEIEMVPDYAQGKNADWADATPSGVFRMTVTNPAALKVLTGASSVHINIEAVDD